MAISTYQSLKESQTWLLSQVTEYNDKATNARSITQTQLTSAKANLALWTQKYNANHEALVQLAETTPALKLKSYFTSDQSQFSRLVLQVTTLLDNLPNVAGETPTASTSSDTTIRNLENRINFLESKLNARTTGSFSAQTSTPTSGMEARFVDLLKLMNEAKDPIKFPIFPGHNVIKNYREWRHAVQNYIATNPAIDAVRIQHLKEACKGTEAEGIVSIFSVATDDFENILNTLDKRFLIARRIITEYVDTMGSINPADSRSNQGHIKLVIEL